MVENINTWKTIINIYKNFELLHTCRLRKISSSLTYGLPSGLGNKVHQFHSRLIFPRPSGRGTVAEPERSSEFSESQRASMQIAESFYGRAQNIFKSPVAAIPILPALAAVIFSPNALLIERDNLFPSLLLEDTMMTTYHKPSYFDESINDSPFTSLHLPPKETLHSIVWSTD